MGVRFPASVRTIAVPIFNNATFPLRRDIEYELTSALHREIQARTPLRLVSSAEEAELVVHGTISRLTETVVAEGRQDQKLESSLLIVVDLVIEDYVHRSRRDVQVQEVEPFSVARGETLEEARRRAIENLAEKILLALEGWE